MPGRAGDDRITGEQAALRRVATLVARAAAPEEVFAAVTEEAGRLLGAHHATMSRYDPDGTATVVASWSSTGAAFPVGTGAALGGRNAHTLVFQTGQAARIDDYAGASGPVAEAAREFGLRAAVGVPVSVEGGLWGVMVVESRAGAAARRHRGPAGRVHRTGRDRDRQRPGPRGAARVRRGAGRAAAGGDAGRPRGAAGRRCSPRSPRKPGGCCTPITRRWAGTAPTAR